MTDTNQIAHEIILTLFKQGKHQVPDTPLQQTTLFNYRNNALITDVTADKTDREVFWPTAVDYVTIVIEWLQYSNRAFDFEPGCKDCTCLYQLLKSIIYCTGL